MHAPLTAKWRYFAAIFAAAILAAIAGSTAQAATLSVCSSGCDFTSIQAAKDAATAGDTITVAAGTYNESGIVLDKSLTLTGAPGAKVVIADNAQVNGFTVTANNVTISGFEIAGPVTSSYLTYSWGSNISRGIVVSQGVAGFSITGNTIKDVRNGILIDGRNNTGSVTNNTIDNTKSAVSIQYTDGTGITLTGNGQSGNGNEWGVNQHLNGNWDGTTVHSNPYPGGTAPSSVQTALLNNSSANNNWTVQDQAYTAGNRTQVQVATTGSAGAQGSLLSPINTVQGGVNAVVSCGTIHVNAGSYTENLTLNKCVNVLGPNADVNPNTETRSSEATITGQVLVTNPTAVFKGFTVTNPSYGGSTVKGIQVYSASMVLTGEDVENNIVKDINNSQAHGSYGIMVQGVISGATVKNNKIQTIHSAGWAHGIEVTPTCGSTAVPQNTTISGNVVSDVVGSNGDSFDFTNDWCDSSNIADASQVHFSGNSLLDGTARNLDSTHQLDASLNYWGGSSCPTLTNITTKPCYLDSGLTAKSDNATLTALSVSAGSLNPAFSSTTTSYSVSVDNSVSSITLNPMAAVGATVTVNSGSALSVGSNTKTITVTSADSSTTRTYTVTVSRAAGSGGSGGSGSSPPPTTTPSNPTPPPNEQAVVTAQPDQPGEATVVVAPPGNGSSPAAAVSVSVGWGAGTFSQPATVVVAPKPELSAGVGSTAPPTPVAGGFAVGSTVVQLTVTSSSGAPVTAFVAPLVLHISAIDSSEVPAYSQDGSSWRAIPRLASPALPEGQADGYYLNADGSVDIYTRHATFFGLLKDTQAPSVAQLNLRVTKTGIRASWHGMSDNVQVTGYVLSRNGHGYKASKRTYVVLPLRAGRYTVRALDAAGNVSKASKTVQVIRRGQSFVIAKS